MDVQSVFICTQLETCITNFLFTGTACESNIFFTFFAILPLYLPILFLLPFPVLPVLEMDTRALYMLGSFPATEMYAQHSHFLLKEDKDLETL